MLRYYVDSSLLAFLSGKEYWIPSQTAGLPLMRGFGNGFASKSENVSLVRYGPQVGCASHCGGVVEGVVVVEF